MSKGKGKTKKQRACWLKSIIINYKVAILIINNFNVAASQTAKFKSKEARSTSKPVAYCSSDEAWSYGANKNIRHSTDNKSHWGHVASIDPVGVEWQFIIN